MRLRAGRDFGIGLVKRSVGSTEWRIEPFAPLLIGGATGGRGARVMRLKVMLRAAGYDRYGAVSPAGYEGGCRGS
jgi:hypothetical protein